MRVSDEDIDAVLKIEAITYLVRDTGEVEPEATLTAKMAADLREARAALREIANLTKDARVTYIARKALEGDDER